MQQHRLQPKSFHSASFFRWNEYTNNKTRASSLRAKQVRLLLIIFVYRIGFSLTTSDATRFRERHTAVRRKLELSVLDALTSYLSLGKHYRLRALSRRPMARVKAYTFITLGTQIFSFSRARPLPAWWKAYPEFPL